jgi:hypothetical protein
LAAPEIDPQPLRLLGVQADEAAHALDAANSINAHNTCLMSAVSFSLPPLSLPE